MKWPIDYFVSTLRMLGMKLKSSEQFVDGGSFTSAIDHMLATWARSSRSAERLRLGLGGELAQQRDAAGALQLRGRRHLGARRRQDRVPAGQVQISTGAVLDLTNPDAIVDEAATMLGIKDHLTIGEHECWSTT